ncbi:hypothetical protein CsSME_00001136 [Camellia sinensis var. sinensis]
MKSATPNDGGGAVVPLLPKMKSPPPERPASVVGAVFNVSTTIVGAGIMSIPATIKVLGVIPALVSIAMVAILVDVSVEFMMRFTNFGESSTYAGLMYESFGRFGSVAVQICVLITNLGCLIIYQIIIGDVLSGTHLQGPVHLGILQEWFGIQWWNTRAFALFFMLIFVMLPLVLIRRLESLRFSSAVSVLLAVVFVGICSVMAISALLEGKAKSPRLMPQLDDQASFFNLFTAVPVIVTAFTFHFNVHPIGTELEKPSDMATAVRISLLVCAVIYSSIVGSLLNDMFMGSTSAVCLAFIFPGAIALRDVHGISGTKDKIVAAIMLVLAIITSAIAISINICNFVGNKS